MRIVLICDVMWCNQTDGIFRQTLNLLYVVALSYFRDVSVAFVLMVWMHYFVSSSLMSNILI